MELRAEIMMLVSPLTLWDTLLVVVAAPLKLKEMMELVALTLCCP